MAASPLHRLKHIVSRWYNGTFIPYKNDPSSPVVVIGGYTKRHWTANAIHAVIDFSSANWKYMITTLIALAALLKCA